MLGAVLPQVQGFAHPLEPHEVSASPFLQPVVVSLEGSMTLVYRTLLTVLHHGQTCRLLIKTLNRTVPSIDLWCTLLVIGLQRLLMTLWASLFSQCSIPFTARPAQTSQLLSEVLVGDSVESLTEVQVSISTAPPSPSDRVSHFVIAYQVGRARFPLGEATLHVPGDASSD